MKTMQSIELALQAHQRLRDEADAKLFVARREHAAALAQLGQLEQYVNETGKQWTDSGQSHGAARLQHYQPFMQKLRIAMDFQRQVIASHEQRLAGLTIESVTAGQRIAALEAMIAMRRKELHQRAQRREQRQTDELASLRYVHQRAAHPAR